MPARLYITLSPATGVKPSNHETFEFHCGWPGETKNLSSADAGVDAAIVPASRARAETPARSLRAAGGGGNSTEREIGSVGIGIGMGHSRTGGLIPRSAAAMSEASHRHRPGTTGNTAAPTCSGRSTAVRLTQRYRGCPGNAGGQGPARKTPDDVAQASSVPRTLAGVECGADRSARTNFSRLRPKAAARGQGRRRQPDAGSPHGLRLSHKKSRPLSGPAGRNAKNRCGPPRPARNSMQRR